MSVRLLKEVILPAAFSKDGGKFVGCSLDSEYKGGGQFMSSVVFVTATVQEGNVTKNIPLVIKFQTFDKERQKIMRTHIQFHNEVLVYSKLLPFIDRDGISHETFPKFYYGVSTLVTPEEDVIVIEDLRPRGFKMAEERVCIDYEHLKLALEKLGKYHALSYISKKEKAKEFFELVGTLKETTLFDGNLQFFYTIKHCIHRALDPMIAAGRHSAVLTKLLSRVDDRLDKFLLALVTPEDPLAVLCHGDFCRNNMMFKYNQDGLPVDVRFFDTAYARYASPVIDIAFFMFMNASKEVRATHWDALLATYHESLTSTLGDVEGPSLQQLHEEMRLKGIYGYVHVSFFLPIMMYGSSFSIDDIKNMTPDECGLKVSKTGGEEGTKMMIELVEELVARGCLTLDHPFLN